MGIPQRTNPKTGQSTQEMQNQGFDEKYNVPVSELVVENTAGTALVRLKTDANGNLTTAIDTTGLATSAKQLPDGHNVVVTSAPTTAVTFTGSTDVATQTTLAKIPGLSVPIHDYIGASYNDGTFTETYTYKTGGSAGTTVATVTVVYVDATKVKLVSVTKT